MDMLILLKLISENKDILPNSLICFYFIFLYPDMYIFWLVVFKNQIFNLPVTQILYILFPTPRLNVRCLKYFCCLSLEEKSSKP